MKRRMLRKQASLASLCDAFLTERNLAYQIPLSTREKDTSCAGKHLRLMSFCRKENIPVRQRIAFFRWEDIALPKEILVLNQEKHPSHLYLEVSDGKTWHSLDATWDPELAPLLPINTWNNFEQEMRIAVEPTKTLTPEESLLYMESLKNFNTAPYLKKQKPFLEALNRYFTEIRECV